METKKQQVIGISGKIGAGKNYLATKLAEALQKHYLTSGETSYATALKDQATEIIEAFRQGITDEELSLIQNIPIEQVRHLRKITKNTVNNTNMNGWSRSEEIRQTLQYLGTDIRRKQDDKYWVNKVEEYFDSNVDAMFIVDVRFPNEADKIHELGGYLIRIDVPDEVILQRTSKRDGLKYSAEALSHESEKALDNYRNYHLVVGENYNADEIITKIMPL